MSNQPLITKYRPTSFDTVTGHEEITAALVRALQSTTTRPHAFLFTGPAGIGKTSIARIIAHDLKADITEIDAASNSGVNDMRGLVESAGHRSLRGAGTRLFIIDECHALSKSAWQALLKLIEEPPEFLYIALCTTEVDKVPETIATRCYKVPLRALRANEISELLDSVCKQEKWEISDEIHHLIVREATGQPRKALSLLDALHEVETVEEAMRIVVLHESEDNPLIKIANLVIKHDTMTKEVWERIRLALQDLSNEDFTTGTVGFGRFIVGAMLRSANPAKAYELWTILDAFVFPANTYDPKTAFVAALGRIVWRNEK